MIVMENAGEFDGASMLFVIFITCAVSLTVVLLVLSFVFGWIRRKKKRDQEIGD